MFYTYFPYEKFTDIEKYFDSEKNLMYMPTSLRDFLLIKSRAKYVYRISESIEYALYLLNCNEEKNRNVAIKIITEVLKYQNINKNSQYYGYWRYFMEVPVEQMLQHESFRKPFHNSVICMALLQIFQVFKESLPQDLIDSIRDAILRTTLTYSSEYTNFLPIEVLHYAYTALISGEIFNKPDLTKYSEQILQNLYTRSKYQNSLAEHNVLFNFENITRILSLLINSAKRTTCVNMAKEMNDMLWKDLATHFHYPTMQIAGPHSKANTFFVDKSFHTFLYYALNEKVNLPHISHKFGELAHCPSKYIQYFSGEKNIEYSQQLVSYGMSFPFFRFSSVATAYIKPSYTFSSFNREFFWNTRHPFTGYFGNYASNNVYCFKLDVLHDFHCYASAALHNIQHYGNALGHITFLTDKGDQHIVYDSHGGIIEAKDFRVRFSIFGKIDDLEITHQKDSLKVTYQDTTIYYNIPYVQFDGYNVTYRFSQEDGAMYFDAIIYSGEKKKINFHELQKAVLEFTFLITSSGKLPCAPINTLQKNILTSKLSADDVVMTLQTPVNPDIETTAFTHDKQMINDIIIEDYALQLNSHIENYTFIEKKIQQQPLALAYPILTDEKELSDKIDQISLDFECAGHTFAYFSLKLFLCTKKEAGTSNHFQYFRMCQKRRFQI